MTTPDCMLWVGAKAGNGYGVRSVSGRQQYAHRPAWEAANGRPVPAGLVVAHRCDTPACINPQHLFVCTQAENLADMRAKGRGNVGLRHGSRTKPERVARGERVGSAKLTADLVRRIRSDRISGGSLSAIATRYGIAFQTVSKIVNRKSWRHIQ